MSTTQASSETNLVKVVRTQMIIIAVLILLLIVALFGYFFSRNKAIYKPSLQEVFFDRGVHDQTAGIGLGNFTRTVRYTELGDYKGVWFDTTTIQQYLIDKMRKIIKRHSDHQKANGAEAEAKDYEWKLGFYWLVKKDVGGSAITPAMSFYVVPVLVHKTSKKVMDYFDTGNLRFYAHPVTAVGKKDGEDDYNVFDEGHLWP